jgi:hypothetical protein
MRLLVKHVHMRGGIQEPQAWKTDVIDEETDKIIGWVHAERSPAFRHISLFSGKYQAEFTSNNSLLECDAFAKGVEAVLNHMVEMREESSPSREST